MWTSVAVSFLCLTVAVPAFAQTPPPAPPSQQSRPVRVFVDCQNAYCDFDYIRTEVPFVDYMRDPKEADLHLLITSEFAGAGGRQYTLNFMGHGPFEGMNDILKYDSLPTDTSDMVRSGLVQMIKVGLVRYVAYTPQGLDLQIAHRTAVRENASRPAATDQPANDPWDFWVFRAGFSGRLDEETSTDVTTVNGSFSANRTTEDWKFNFSNSVRYNESQYTYSDGTSYTSVRREWFSNTLLVKSLSDHWSAGLATELGSTTYYNRDLALEIMPAIEWNLFPYSESTRRQFTFLYSAGFHYYDYMRETIYGKLQEHVLVHSASAAMDTNQPWGRSEIDFSFSQALNKPGRYRLTASGEIDIRVTRGLSLSFDASASFIRDQIYLPAGDATPEEILSRQRQLATGHRFSVSAGISYTFGSIFNNIVNSRM